MQPNITLRNQQQNTLDSLTPGDLVEFLRVTPIGSYSHWGVFVGGENIIHLGEGEDEDWQIMGHRRGRRVQPSSMLSACGFYTNKAIICIQNFWDVAERSNVFKNNSHGYDPLEQTVIVHRAMSRLGQIGYNPLYNNCEQFSLWCRYGIHISYQVDKFMFIFHLIISSLLVVMNIIDACLDINPLIHKLQMDSVDNARELSRIILQVPVWLYFLLVIRREVFPIEVIGGSIDLFIIIERMSIFLTGYFGLYIVMYLYAIADGVSFGKWVILDIGCLLHVYFVGVRCLYFHIFSRNDIPQIDPRHVYLMITPLIVLMKNPSSYTILIFGICMTVVICSHVYDFKNTLAYAILSICNVLLLDFTFETNCALSLLQLCSILLVDLIKYFTGSSINRPFITVFESSNIVLSNALSIFLTDGHTIYTCFAVALAIIQYCYISLNDWIPEMIDFATLSRRFPKWFIVLFCMINYYHAFIHADEYPQDTPIF